MRLTCVVRCMLLVAWPSEGGRRKGRKEEREREREKGCTVRYLPFFCVFCVCVLRRGDFLLGKIEVRT